MSELTAEQRLRNALCAEISAMHGYTPQVIGELIRDWLTQRGVPADGVIEFVRDEYQGIPPKPWNLADAIIDRSAW